jgi:hypothetical protein
MGLFHVLNWRPNKYPRTVSRLAPATPVGAGATYTTHTQLQLQPGGGRVTVLDGRSIEGAHPRGLSVGPNMRRSDEGLRRYTYVDADEGAGSGAVGYGTQLSGLLTAARRASSWGQGDKEEYTEMVSVRSVEQGLNEHLVGARGVFRVGPEGLNGFIHGAEPGGVLMDVMMPDSDEEIDSDEERRRRALEPRPPRAPLVYGPLEQAEDNMRFGQPAYNKTPSLDGDDEDEAQLSDREVERRRVGAVVEQLQQLPVREHIPIHVHGNGAGVPYGQESNPRGEYEDLGEQHNGDAEIASDVDRDDDFYEDEDEDDDDDDEALMVRRPAKRLD